MASIMCRGRQLGDGPSNYVSSGGTPFPWSEAVDDPCDLNTLFFTHAAWGRL